MRTNMDKLSSSCLEKLETFRIKELKDVLTRIGVAKQGKRQVLIDKVMAIVLLPERQQVSLKGSRAENSIKYGLSREEVAKIIDDVYRKMRGSSARDLATAGDILAGQKTQSIKRVETSTRCPCGSKVISESMIQCDDPKCMVWQHLNCVLIPEKEGLKAEHPSQFYCELCRIQHGDPYCVAISHPLLPSKLIPAIPAFEGTNSLQNVEKSFLLSRIDQDMLLKPEYDIQVWCVLLNDKVAFRMHWPLHSELRVNGRPLRATNRPPHQSLGINGRDDGVRISDCVREGSNSISMSAADGRPFCIGVRIIQRCSVDQVLSRIPSEDEGESFDTALARVRRCIGGSNGQVENGNDSDSDLEVISECGFVNLRCPMSGSRMKVAGRFKTCVHMGCFDLHTFVELNQRTRKWQCPICLTNYSLDDLIIDPFLTRIVKAMKSYGEDIVEVEMKPDGQWRPKVEGEAKLKEIWRLPDGSFGSSIGENRSTSMQLLPLKAVKIEENLPFEKVPLKIGIKRTRDGTWQVTQTNGNRVWLNNGVHDQQSMFISADYSRSSSMAANTNEGFSFGQEREEMLQFSQTADMEVNSIPTAVPVSSHEPAGFLTPGSETRQNEEVIILSDTEDENVGECDQGEENDTGSMMLQPSVGMPTAMDERNLEADISFLEAEPLQDCTVDFFEDTGDESIPLDSWLQDHDPPFGQMGSTKSTRKPSVHQRPRTSTQTSKRPSHGLVTEQIRGNGTSDSRVSGYGRPGQYIGEEVENGRHAATADPSLRLFLPPQPAIPVGQYTAHEPPRTSAEGLQDGWFSLSLAGGERVEESQSVGRASPFSTEDASQDRFDPVADPANVLLNLSKQGTLDSSYTHRRPTGVAIHRSAHRPRSYFRVESDSDD